MTQLSKTAKAGAANSEVLRKDKARPAPYSLPVPHLGTVNYPAELFSLNHLFSLLGVGNFISVL